MQPHIAQYLYNSEPVWAQSLFFYKQTIISQMHFYKHSQFCMPWWCSSRIGAHGYRCCEGLLWVWEKLSSSYSLFNSKHMATLLIFSSLITDADLLRFSSTYFWLAVQNSETILPNVCVIPQLSISLYIKAHSLSNHFQGTSLMRIQLSFR